MGWEMRLLGSGSVASHARLYWTFRSSSMIETRRVSIPEMHTYLVCQENEWQLGGSELAVMLNVVTGV